jgi:hypothetical protein
VRPPIRVARITLAILVAVWPAHAFGQAFTPPAQIGSVTAGFQWVDNTGHFTTDGTLLPGGASVTTSALVEVEYGITDRLAVSGGIPYVFARYTGALPSFSGLEHDECRCWQSSFQDFNFSARYRFGDQFWAVTPQVRYGLPSHDYPFEGEAVVGPSLQQLLIGLSAGARLTSVLPRATVQVGYSYSLGEQPLEDVDVHRSTGYFELGYPVSRSLYVRGIANWLYTHGGLEFRDLLGSPEYYEQRDRVIGAKYWHFGGGVSYSLGRADLFVSLERYLWGWDAHDGIAYTAGTTWYFDLTRPTP